MNQIEFNNWLFLKGMSKKVCSDICSRLKRLEKELGNIDIDEEYKKNKCRNVIKKFNNKKKEFEKTNLPYDKYIINTYKYSLKKYISFIESNNL